MKAHLLRPDRFPAPPEYKAYVVERRFWQEFGAAAPPLSQWPHHKITQYTVIMQVENEVANARRAASDAGPQASQPDAGKAAMTEQVFQRLRAAANPPPMPPPA